MSRQLGRVVHLATAEADVVAAEVPSADAPVGAAAVSAVVRGVGRELRHFALVGQPPVRDVGQQLEALENPLKPQEPVRSVEEQIAAMLADASPEQRAKAAAHGLAPMLEAAP
jgi:hypothetical protein